MQRLTLLTVVLCGAVLGCALLPDTSAKAANPAASLAAPLTAPDPSPPDETVRLIFIHHSCGENWLADGNGGLGIALRDNNYFVSDTYYGWYGGDTAIGDRTDIGNWWEWFLGPQRDAILADLYAEDEQATSYSRLGTAPAGENDVILFKSCYPNSALRGDADDPPTTGTNPLEGEDCYSEDHTVANAKAIYRDLLTYFQTSPDKLFVAVTAPPIQDGTYSSNARAFNNWLVNDWLAEYPLDNVRVWDFYNVLTSNGGNWSTNDLGAESGNHHRYRNGAIEHLNSDGGNTAAYPNGGSDNHPSPAGNRKATGEFVPVLNVWVNQWLASDVTPEPSATGTAATSTATTSPTNMPSSTPSATSTPTATLPAGQHDMSFQRGLLPDSGYDSAPDTILSRDEPDANLGGLEHIEVFYGDEPLRHSLLRWDLSLLPEDASVVSASVRLWRFDGDAASDMTVALYRVTRDWVEGTGTDFWPEEPYDADGATWDMASAYETWNQAGGDIDATTDYGGEQPGIIGSTVLPVGMETGAVDIDATAAVRAWEETGVPNYGLLLVPLSGDATYHYLRSGDYGAPEYRPLLTVTYTIGASPEPTDVLLLPLILRS